MARTTQEIYNNLLQNKVSQGIATNNNPLNFINRLLWVIAVAIQLSEQVYDLFLIELNERLNTAAIGSAPWIRRKILEFQWDDVIQYNLVLDEENLTINYDVVDETKRIVTQVAVQASGSGTVLTKVARGQAPSYLPLTTDQQSALSNYLDLINPVGQFCEIISEEGDDLQLTLLVNRQSITTDTDLRNRINQAIRDYVYSIDFDGILYLTRIVDSVQKVNGVVDVIITSSSRNSYLNRLTNTTFNNNTILDSGYVRNITTTINLIDAP